MADDDLAVAVSESLAPWAEQLGDDRVAYANHVIRVLLFCDALAEASDAAAGRPSRRPEFIACGVFHDLGIWTDRTFDYLVPSIELAADHLQVAGHEELIPLVSEMIDQHHKQRAAGAEDDPVELFRRADLVDVSLGARRFGIPRRRVSEIRRAYPNRGFHRRLVQLSAKRLIEHPTSPLPMFKW
ncbi:MAG: hypothetical protein QM648_09930 [Solirubrobacterales bacterium]